MAQKEQVRYERRTLSNWVEAAWNGDVAITDFQRSFVWDSGKATDYILAILMGKPVGVYLILATSEKPQFEPRSFNKLTTSLKDVSELVLDGQQRLTSLMHALYEHPERRFFIKVGDLSAETLEVVDVICESKRTGRTSKGLDDPATAFEQNLIPIDILRKTGPRKGKLSPLANWCIEIGQKVKGMEGNEARQLEDLIFNFVDKCFFQRELWYCRLPATTDAKEAADIFVATNTSSVKIKRFDIEVAEARGLYDEDLRAEIQDAYDKSDVLVHYFSEDAEEYIPDIGEWMLKVACLHVGQPPKESNYRNAVTYLLGGNDKYKRDERRRRLSNVFQDLDWSLRRAEGYGAATDKMLPSRPVLHVLSALRSEVQKIGKPARVDAARRLLDAYYWRCLFSNRHEVQANDRLYEDYNQLKEALEKIGEGKRTISAFDDQDHPLYDEDHLIRHAGWIGSSRLGKALVTVVMGAERRPTEWMTGTQLSATTIRELQGLRKLDRHHVFPKKALVDGNVDENQIQHGLNGVILDQRTNLRLWKVPPSEYVDKMLEELVADENELRRRVESHVVPYKELKSRRGSICQRYERYLQQRAKLMAERIFKLATIS